MRNDMHACMHTVHVHMYGLAQTNFSAKSVQTMLHARAAL